MSSFLIDRIFLMCYTDKKQRRFLKNMDNQKQSNIKRVIACLMAVLMILTVAPLSAFAADEHTHEYVYAQGDVKVTFQNGKYSVSNETYKCASCNRTETKNISSDNFNKVVDSAKALLDSSEYRKDSKEYTALKNALSSLTGLADNSGHYELFINEKLKNVTDAAAALQSAEAKDVKSELSVKFVFRKKDGTEQEKTVSVLYGENAEAPEIPQLCYDNAKHYNFEKWDKSLGNVQSNLVVKAVYSAGEDHKLQVNKEEKVATCTEGGNTAGKSCSVCGYEIKSEDIPALGHEWGEVKPSYIGGEMLIKTCTRSGCGATYTEHAKYSDHSIINHEAKNATCTEDGYKAYSSCQYCNWTNKEIIPATGHKEVVDAAKAATCTEAGLTAGKHCSVCKATLVEQVNIAAPGHDSEAKIIDDAHRKALATCESAAVYYCSCSRCGKKSTETFTDGEASGHDFSAKLIEDARRKSEADCKSPAIYFYSCKNCKAVSEDKTFTSGNALGHKLTDWTLSNDKKLLTRNCSVCSNVPEKLCAPNDKGETVHSLETVPAKKATCTENGYAEYKKCTVCDYTEGYQVIPAAHTPGHTEKAVTVLPTCLDGGKTEEVVYCTVKGCGKELSRKTVDTSALGHDYGSFTVDEGAGTHSKVCKRSDCSAQTKDHKVTESHKITKIEAKAATCVAEGNTAGETCSVCGYTTVEKIAATGIHTEKVVPEVPATCTEKGKTAGKVCSVCGKVLEEQKEIPALGHKEVKGEEKPATCTETGLTGGIKCSVCGKVLEEQKEIPKKEHTVVPIPDVLGDCTTDKSVGGKKCSVCGAIIEDPVITPALGHAYEVFTPAKKATLSENGATEGRKCAVCGDEIPGEVIAKIDSVALTVSKVNYNGKAWTPGVIVKDADGKTLTKGVDFTVGYKNNVNPGKALVTVSFIGDYDDTVARSFVINYSYTARTAKLAANQTTNSIKASWSAVSGAAGYRVQLYRGKKLVRTVETSKTSVTFKKLENGKKLSAGTEYKIVVTAFSRIGGKDYYSTASRSLLTATKPVAPVVKSVSAGKKSVTLKWNKVAGATGYTVYYSTKKNSGFKPVKATTKTYRTVKNLKSGKTYYVKVVANKRVDGKRIVSNFSKTYKVTVK